MVEISEAIKRKISPLSIHIFKVAIHNSKLNEKIWMMTELAVKTIHDRYTLEQVREREAIRFTREAYKALGKDPNRYRPSADALCRRAVKNNSIYQVSAAVDAINTASLLSGYCINGFDATKVKGSLRLDVGKGEEFEAIGRGLLNIENLPVFYDEEGPIGSPTSDSVRTSIDEETREIIVIIDGLNATPESIVLAAESFRKAIAPIRVEMLVDQAISA